MEANAAARELLTRVLALEPSYARAWALLGLTYHHDLFSEFTTDRNPPLAHLVEASRTSIALDGADPVAHAVACLAALWSGDHDLAISEGREAVRLNPSGSAENATLCAALDFAGRPQEGLVFGANLLRVNPRPHHPSIEVFLATLARAQLGAGQFEAAAESSKRATRGMPHLFEAHLLHASSLAHLGRQSEASAALLKARELRPLAVPASWSRYKDAAASWNIMDGLRKAGWTG
jgi:adenylate cyclase